MADGPEWFAPKRFGYGASYPIAWQGWAVIAVYGAILLLAARFLRDSPLALAGIVVPATAVLLLITVKTTRGGWHWRWSWKLDREEKKSPPRNSGNTGSTRDRGRPRDG
jgi:hypothetical protein